MIKIPSKVSNTLYTKDTMSSACVATQDICPNLLRGFCPGCERSHNVWDSRMGCSAFNLNFEKCLWVHLGKWANLSLRVRKKIEKHLGKIKRIDFVPMKGRPDKGGSYWCAVIHFVSISQWAIDELLSGRAIFVKSSNKVVRLMLMRTEVKEKKDLEERQLVAEAAIQAQKALFAAKKAVSNTECFAWIQSHVTEEEVLRSVLDL